MSNKRYRVVEHLVSLPDIHLGPVDCLGHTPLWDALTTGDRHAAEILFTRGAPVQQHIATEICKQASNNNAYLIEMLLDFDVDVLARVRPLSSNQSIPRRRRGQLRVSRRDALNTER